MLQGLFGWHFLMLLGLIGVPIAAAVLLYVRARKARVSGDPTPVVNLTLVLSVFYGALCVIGAVIGFVSTLTSPSVTMTVPVQTYWPMPLPGLTVTGGQTADVVAGG